MLKDKETNSTENDFNDFIEFRIKALHHELEKQSKILSNLTENDLTAASKWLAVVKKNQIEISDEIDNLKKLKNIRDNIY